MMKFRKFIKRAGKQEAGFTLIELMVVVVILGILASVTLPRVLGDYTTTAKANADKANLKNLQFAVDKYMFDMGVTASSINWDTDTEIKAGLIDTNSDSKWKGPYIDQVPKKQDDTSFVVENGTVK